ncbi:MAG: indolepyruvate oxidoreductase subunit beta [Proteobacteria bacterium]|nr:indolepyruvate oxidoreductase subunit beta [Pseudomonadota bacterium]
MSKEQINIVVCGIGGQGVVLAARIIAEAVLAEGLKVVTADVPPISQRFAPTLSFVRIGEGVYSETVPEAEADLMIGFEPLQALRYGIAFASEDGVVLLNTRPIDLRPNPSIKYPALEDILACFEKMGVRDVRSFDASKVAIEKTGTMLALNMVMLGASYATHILGIPDTSLENVIRKVSPQGTVEANIAAFRAGTRKEGGG